MQKPGFRPLATTEKALIELRHIHCALGHASDEVLLRALKDSRSPHHLQLRKYVKLMDACNVCPMGTQRAESHPLSATWRTTEYLARLIIDMSGRQPVASIGGYWYFLLIVDDATRNKWVEILNSVSQASAIFDNFLCTIAHTRLTKLTPRASFRLEHKSAGSWRIRAHPPY